MKDFKEKYKDITIPKELDNIIEDAMDKAEKKNVLKFTKPLIAAACIVIVALGLNPILVNNFNHKPSANFAINEDKENPAAASVAEVSPLPTVDSYENLKNILEKASLNEGITTSGSNNRDAADISSSKSVANIIYSTTNSQVTGVNEADIVKTDGQYIYSISSNKLVITKVYPASNMEVVQNIALDGEFRAKELFLHNNYLIAVGYLNIPIRETITSDAVNKQFSKKDSISLSDTKTIIYDISDRKQAKHVKTIDIAGSYVSSRKIGSLLYLISNQYIKDSTKPYYRDTSLGAGTITIDYTQIKYCPEALAPSFINVASVNLASINEKVKIDSYVGTGYSLYVSQKNLYTAGYNGKDASTLYKFSLKDGKVNYIAKGEVKGKILNQFSMDEYNDYFRVTTTSTVQDNKIFTQKNNLYVLDNKMNIAGKLENLAPGEQIYSTRFMENKAYMVTFRTTDPLFVIDLSNPSSPKVMGELKIPGFSSYLHPYDENHVIGFGKDTEEIIEKDPVSHQKFIRVYIKGIKISLFDVSDMKNPKEKFTTVIGDAGTESELLYNHKALLFSKEKNLFALPVTVGYTATQLKLLEAKRLPKDFGLPAFEGAYVFSVDIKKGFTLKGTVTHNKDIKYEPPYFSTEEARRNKIQRVLYINDTLYTISNGKIKANDVNSMKELNIINLP